MRRLKRRVGQLTDERLPDKGFFPFESVNANLACPRIGSVWHGTYLTLVNAPESNLYESLPWLVKLRLQKLERVFPPAEVSPIVPIFDDAFAASQLGAQQLAFLCGAKNSVPQRSVDQHHRWVLL